MPAPVNRQGMFSTAWANPLDLLLSPHTPAPTASSCRVPPPSEMVCRVLTAAEEQALAVITPAKLRQVVGGGSSERMTEVAAALERHRLAAEINTLRRVVHFVAQCAHESQGFTRLVENLGYRPEQTLGFSAIKSLAQAAELLAQDTTGEAFANHVYGGRMLNTEPGDGYRYRGRGFLQLTGRDNYTRATKDLGTDFVNHPDKVAEIDFAAQTSVWFWKTNNINVVADLDDVDGVSRKVNRYDAKSFPKRRQKVLLARQAFYPRY